MTIQNYSQLITQLKGYESANLLTDAYYEGERRVPRLKSIGANLMQAIHTVVGWPATTVDVLDERLEWRGWDADIKYGLKDIYLDNQLAYESGLAQIDSLLYGVSFGMVGTGAEGEPSELITIETPKHMTGIYDRRKRRLRIAAQRIVDENNVWLNGVLYEEDRTTYYKRATETSRWKVDFVDKHNLGRVPVVQFINRGRAGRREGKSEITKAVRSYTDMAVRTLSDMEVNRDFFSAPQRYVLGAKEDQFTDQNGTPIPGWVAILGSLWNLERDEEWVEQHPGSDGLPTVGEFSPNPPGPFIDQVKGLSQMFSAEVGIPSSYLGFTDQNPPSADAIRALEARLVKRAERRILGWDNSWIEIGQLAVQMKTGTLPPRGDMVTVWRDPATPTNSADADRAVKLVGAGILPKESSVTYEMVGLSPSQQKRLERDKMKETMMAILRGGDNATGAGTDPNNPGAPTDQPGQPTNDSRGVANTGGTGQ